MHYINIVGKNPLLLKTVLLAYLRAYHNFHKTSTEFSTVNPFIITAEAAFHTDIGPLTLPGTNKRHLKIEVLVRDFYTNNLSNQNS